MFGGTFVAVLVGRHRRREESEQFLKHYEALPMDLNFKDGGKCFRYKGFVFPLVFGKRVFRDLENFQAHDDDVYVVSFPKTGTTWIQEIVYLITNKLDVAKAKEQTLESRFPYLEFIYPGMNAIKKMKSPRLIKTHLPLDLLPPSVREKNCKMVYVTRNPKDTAVSFFHFLRMLTVTDYQGTFKELVNKLMRDELPYCPFWQHVLPFWERRSDQNVMFLKYEDLHKDLRSVVIQVADFLGTTLTEDEVDTIVEHCSFGSMQQNPMVNYDHWDELGLRKKETTKFLRKGKVGDWQNYFTPGLNLIFEDWIQKNAEGTGLRFDYTLPLAQENAEVKP